MLTNLSILLLSLANHRTTPLLSCPISQTLTKTSILRSRFLHFSTHFYFSQNPFSDLTVSLTTFHQFLSSPIYLNTHIFENKLYQNHNLVLRERGDLLFSDCVFDTCVSNSAGGALQLYSDTVNASELSVDRCLFRCCSANMHGGAIYALVARYTISDSCFVWCTAKDRQAALLRGEAAALHLINLTVVCRCGRGIADRTAFSTASLTVAVMDVNSSYNNVAQWAAGYYLESNRMTFMKFCVFAHNLGVNVLNYQLKSQETALEFINLVNNSASLTWKTLIYVNTNVELIRFYFVDNPNPLVITDKAAGGINLVQCVFDVPFNNRFYSGSISHTDCEFDAVAPSLPVYSAFRSRICVNQFGIVQEDSNSEVVIWWVLAIVVCAVAGGVFLYGSPKPKDDDERVPFKRGRRRLLD
jgi:hypothetical protein